VDETLSEKEQIDEMRAWWKENGSYVIAGLLLGIGSIFGFNQWKSSQLNTQLEASALFELLVDEVAENRLEPAEVIATDIYTDYAETVYADEARLAMARVYMGQGRDEDAAAVLRDLLSDGNNKDIKQVGRIRLAKVLLYQGKADEVLTLLEGQASSGFVARFNEVIGDAYFAKGQYQDAEAAYQAALADPNAAQVLDSALVQMKIFDLPDSSALAALATDPEASGDEGEAAAVEEEEAAKTSAGEETSE